jgi:hypothetical protein
VKRKQTESIQVDPVKAEQVLILPGYLFFVETIEVPSELESSEIHDFAELSLESIAPFPIEQLCWGYLYQKDMSTLLLYAAYQGRIKNDGFTDLNDYAWVVPDFATLAGARFGKETLILLEGPNNSASMVYFESDTEIPKSVWVDTFTEPLTEDVIQSLRAGIRDLPQTSSTLHLRPTVATVNENGLPTFEHAVPEQDGDWPDFEGWQNLSPKESQLWQMDVRSADFKASEQSKRRMSALVARITGWAAIFTLVLAGAEVLLFASQSWLQTQLAQIERQQEAVLKVAEKQTLVNKLDQVTQNELRPIEMLGAANEIRLKLNLGIEYDSVVIEDDNHITIEGKASSITALNRYVESLENSGLFELLVEPEYLTKSGKTTFNISLAYFPKTTAPEERPPSDEENATTNIFQPGKEGAT